MDESDGDGELGERLGRHGVDGAVGCGTEGADRG